MASDRDDPDRVAIKHERDSQDIMQDIYTAFVQNHASTGAAMPSSFFSQDAHGSSLDRIGQSLSGSQSEPAYRQHPMCDPNSNGHPDHDGDPHSNSGPHSERQPGPESGPHSNKNPHSSESISLDNRLSNAPPKVIVEVDASENEEEDLLVLGSLIVHPLSHSGPQNLICDNCVKDYEKEPGLICSSSHNSGLDCDRCEDKGFDSCCKISLSYQDGQPRDDRKPIVELQLLAEQVHALSIQGKLLPPEMKEKLHKQQAIVTVLVNTIVDSAAKERYLRRVLRCKREAITAAEKKVEAQKRKTARQQTQAAFHTSRADTAETKAIREKERRKEAEKCLNQAVAQNRELNTRVGWLRANNKKLQQQMDQINTANTQLNSNSQAELNAIRSKYSKLEHQYQVMRANAEFHEREKNEAQKHLIASQVDLGIAKAELEKTVVKHVDNMVSLTHELTQASLEKTEKLQAIIARLEYEAKKTAEDKKQSQVVEEKAAQDCLEREVHIEVLQIRNTEQASHITRLETALKAATNTRSTQIPLPHTEMTMSQSFNFWGKLPPFIKAQVIEFVVASLPSMAQATFFRGMPGRLDMPDPTRLLATPTDAVMEHLRPHLSEGDMVLMQNYCNISLEFRVRCLVSQTMLRFPVQVKGLRRWEEYPSEPRTPLEHITDPFDKAAALKSPSTNDPIHLSAGVPGKETVLSSVAKMGTVVEDVKW
ncbi:hypothetical protein GQ53DRAFT_822087 [Thozetella sp. PMI_491]|nr:hypothetical protein GQ53DRAFT_822087 [Thozetella sp. PMI_491]